MDGEKKSAFKAPANKDLVFDYHPKEFPAVSGAVAEDFVKGYTGKAQDFEINELIAQQSSVATLQKRQVEEKIQKEALERLRLIQEKAYREAYDLGLIEGIEKSFVDSKAELKERVEKLDGLLSEIQNFKSTLLKVNEAQLVQLVTAVASQIALKEIKADPETTVRVLQQMVEELSDSESIRVTLSNDDLVFIEGLREKLASKAEAFKNVKLQASDSIESGGCIIDTDFGTIDATIHQRVERVIQTLNSKTPKVD
jgi:flagellar assembly protein FliH